MCLQGLKPCTRTRGDMRNHPVRNKGISGVSSKSILWGRRSPRLFSELNTLDLDPQEDTPLQPQFRSQVPECPVLLPDAGLVVSISGFLMINNSRARPRRWSPSGILADGIASVMPSSAWVGCCGGGTLSTSSLYDYTQGEKSADIRLSY